MRGADFEHFQVWDCGEFRRAVALAFAELQVDAEFLGICIECGGDKDVYSLAHGGRSNMFDDVDESEATTSYEELDGRATVARKPRKLTVRK